MNNSSDHFFNDDGERKIATEFLEKGYHIFPFQERDWKLLEDITDFIYRFSQESCQPGKSYSKKDFLDGTFRFLPLKDLNAFRVKLIGALDGIHGIRENIYRLFQKQVHCLVGNELAMQRSLNLSIQYPQDDSSLFPIHADIWTGSSPFEVVAWFPLVNCYRTKSMFILPLPQTREIYRDFTAYFRLDAEGFFQAVKKDLVWLEVPYGHGLLFSHSLIHGNRINEEEEVRWSFNMRFKSLLSPYGSKELGESFLPFNVRPATRMGYEFYRRKGP